MKKILLTLLILLLPCIVQAKMATCAVNTAANDNQCIAGDCNYSTETSLRFPYSSELRTYFRWSINLPANASISTAYLKVYASFTVDTATTIALDYVAEDSNTLFTSTLTLGGTPINWGLTNWTGGAQYTSGDIKALLSAWMGRAGYTSGNYFVLSGVSAGGAVRNVDTYDYGDHSHAPVLEVTYTGGDAVIEMLMAEPHVKTKQYVYVQIWNQDAGDVLHVYLDNSEVATYTIQEADVPANAATRFEKVILLDYTGLSASTHHIYAILKTSDGVSRMGIQVEGKDLKTWTTTHSGYPKVGINENNAICIRTKAGNGCDVFFPIAPFMWDKSKWYKPECYYDAAGVCSPFKPAFNSLNVEGYAEKHDENSWNDYLNAAAATTDADSVKHFYATGPARGGTMAKIIAKNKAHSALLAWIWEDEPAISSITFETMRSIFETTKAGDTDHPHHVSHYGAPFAVGARNNGVDLSYMYLTGRKQFINDITGGDYYPYEFAGYPPNGVYVSLESALSVDDSYIAYNYGLIPFITIVQPGDEKTCQTTDSAGVCTEWATGATAHCYGSSGALGSRTWTPAPTPAQVKNELWLRVIHGAKGITIFDYFCPVSQSSIDAVAAFKRALETGTDPLAPIILAAKSTKYTPVIRTVNGYTISLNHATVKAGTDGRVDYMVREYGGFTWVFAARVKKMSGETFAACNTTGVSAGAVRCTEGATFGVWPDSTNTNTKSATIPVTGLAADTVIAVYGEARNVKSASGSFTDNFTDYDVHIYQLGADATKLTRQQLRTVAITSLTDMIYQDAKTKSQSD